MMMMTTMISFSQSNTVRVRGSHTTAPTQRMSRYQQHSNAAHSRPTHLYVTRPWSCRDPRQQGVDGGVHQHLRSFLKQIQVANADQTVEETAVPGALVIVFVAHAAPVAANVN